MVLANGCFDLLHDGHVAHLKEARKMGDVLVIGLTLDEYVCKPGRPILSWTERASILKELRCVNAVFPCRDAVEAIYAVRPSIFVKGSDYSTKGLLQEEVDACQKVGAVIQFTNADKKSTTDIINRIRSK